MNQYRPWIVSAATNCGHVTAPWLATVHHCVGLNPCQSQSGIKRFLLFTVWKCHPAVSLSFQMLISHWGVTRVHSIVSHKSKAGKASESVMWISAPLFCIWEPRRIPPNALTITHTVRSVHYCMLILTANNVEPWKMLGDTCHSKWSCSCHSSELKCIMITSGFIV